MYSHRTNKFRASHIHFVLFICFFFRRRSVFQSNLNWDHHYMIRARKSEREKTERDFSFRWMEKRLIARRDFFCQCSVRWNWITTKIKLHFLDIHLCAQTQSPVRAMRNNRDGESERASKQDRHKRNVKWLSFKMAIFFLLWLLHYTQLVYTNTFSTCGT